MTPETVADAIYEALRRHPRQLVQGEPVRGEKTLIDGNFYLVGVARRVLARLSTPIPMALYCPECGIRHVDENEWATRPHRSHLCAGCSHIWRPADIATVGVATLKTAGTSDSPIPVGRPWREAEPIPMGDSWPFKTFPALRDVTIEYAEIDRLTPAERQMLRLAARAPDGNPWPLIGIRQRAGGAKARMFEKMQKAGLFDQLNRITPKGRGALDR